MAANEKRPGPERRSGASPAHRAEPEATGQPEARAQEARPEIDRPEAAAARYYYCGAATKKGTPCTRKVKGGGRCWQHKGMEAMVPESELEIMPERTN